MGGGGGGKGCNDGLDGGWRFIIRLNSGGGREGFVNSGLLNSNSGGGWLINDDGFTVVLVRPSTWC